MNDSTSKINALLIDLNLSPTREVIDTIIDNIDNIEYRQKLYVLQATYPNLLVAGPKYDYKNPYPLNIAKPPNLVTELNHEVYKLTYDLKIKCSGLILVRGNIKYLPQFVFTFEKFMHQAYIKGDLNVFDLYQENGHIWLTDHNIASPISWLIRSQSPIYAATEEYLQQHFLEQD